MYNLDNPIDNVDSSDIEKEYSDLFKGIWHLPGKHKIHIDPNVTPVVHPPRPIPISMRDKVRNELSRMVREGIIKKVKKPTSWVNSMVVVTKPNGSIRICIEPRDLNKAVKRQHYPLLTVEEVVSRMPNAKIFSKTDCTLGFWQLELDDESSKLCTFNTPFRRYRYLRLPFGIKCASELYQSKMSEMIKDIEGHHHHIHFRAMFSSTEGWAFWQVFLEGVLSTQNDSEGQQNPYLASFCHSQALHPMISLACQIFSVQPHSACVLLQSSLCCALHVQTISSYWCGAPHLSPGCQALWEGSLS